MSPSKMSSCSISVLSALRIFPIMTRRNYILLRIALLLTAITWSSVSLTRIGSLLVIHTPGLPNPSRISLWENLLFCHLPSSVVVLAGWCVQSFL
jgi:hypothetical protein